jgi:hypothetical protein
MWVSLMIAICISSGLDATAPHRKSPVAGGGPQVSGRLR